jgi:hypothetical protein
MEPAQVTARIDLSLGGVGDPEPEPESTDQPESEEETCE